MNDHRYEIRFFDPANRYNACIVDVSRMNTDQIKKLLVLQKDQGRIEIEFLTKAEVES